MKPYARIASVIEVLSLRQNSKYPVDQILTRYLRERRFIGSKDRRYITEMIFRICRNQLHYNELIGQEKPSPRALALADLVIHQQHSPEEMFVKEPYAPTPLNKQEREVLEKLQQPAEVSEAAQYNLQPEIFEKLQTTYADWSDLMQSLDQDPTVDLRANTARNSREEVAAKLKQQGLEAQLTKYSKYGLKLAKRGNIKNTGSWKSGVIDVQDEAAQIAVSLCASLNPAMALDYCAGAGGKSLALATIMGDRIKVTAFDVDRDRLDNLAPRQKRLKLRKITTTPNISGKYDLVMADVPCSGSGTWRRNPDQVWQLTAARLKEYSTLQQQILQEATEFVKPGGHLAYMTCSIFPEENQNQLEEFLKCNNSFELVNLEDLWKKSCCEKYPGEENYLQLLPHKHNTDGFFVSILKKTS